MFKTIVQEKCQIKKEEQEKFIERSNKRYREKIIVRLSEIFGDRWENIIYKEHEDHITIEYDVYNIDFYLRWRSFVLPPRAKANVKCPKCNIIIAEKIIYGACDIADIIQNIDCHECPNPNFLKRIFKTQ